MIGSIKDTIFLAIIAALLAWGGVQYFRGSQIGAAKVETKILKQTAKKIDNAQKADSRSRTCSHDPDCRMSDDGFKRD